MLAQPTTSHDERLRRLNDGWSLSGAVFAIQVLLLAILQFGRFGTGGYAVVLTLLAAYARAQLCRLACVLSERKWLSRLLQMVTPAPLHLDNERPALRYDASDVQNLVGRSTAEVEAVLSSHRVLTGYEGHADVSWAVSSYNGMTVYYDATDRIVAVRAED